MLAFKIAARFLTSNKAQMFLISLGIAVGVSVQIFIGALIFGLQDSLIETTVGTSPHIVISSKQKGDVIDNYEDIIKGDYNLLHSSVVLDKSGFIENNLTYPVLLRGFNLSDANKIYDIESRIVEGRMPNNNEVLVGITLLKEANLEVGDMYTIKTPEGVKKQVTISGVFDFEVTSLNDSWLLADLKTVQEIFNTGDVITSYEIQVEDVFKADEIASTIKTTYKVTNWKDTNQSLLSGLNGQSVSSLMIQVFVLVSVVLGIASVLIISVVQKRKQIGILKAMGIKDNEAAKIFIFQGLLLGVLGATLGLLFGLGLLIMFSRFAVNPDGTPVVAVTIDYGFMVLSWGIAVVASTIASIIPSISSKKLSPMEVIKNG